MGCTVSSSPNIAPATAVLREILSLYFTKRSCGGFRDLGNAKSHWILLQQLLSVGKIPEPFDKLNKNQLSVFFDRYWQYTFKMAIIYKGEIVRITIFHPEGVPHITSKQWNNKHLDEVVQCTMERGDQEQLKRLNRLARERQKVRLLDPKL